MKILVLTITRGSGGDKYQHDEKLQGCIQFLHGESTTEIAVDEITVSKILQLIAPLMIEAAYVSQEALLAEARDILQIESPAAELENE